MVAAPDVLRVSVVAGRRRVDLVVPAAVRVAELLPELATYVRDGGASRALRLSVAGGAPLSPGAGLVEQGVADGSVLTLTLADDHVAPPAVEDDLTLLVAECAEGMPRPPVGGAWSAGWLAVGGPLLLGAAGVVLDGGWVAASVSATVAVVLLLSAALEVRGAARPPALVCTTWVAVVHAGAAGLAAGALGAGAAWIVVGAIATALARGRAGPLTGVPLAGAVLVVAGTVTAFTPTAPSSGLTITLVAAVLAGELVPWLAAASAGLLPPPLDRQPPRAPERERVADGVRRAHGVLLACSTAAALLLVVLAPVAATRGPWGVAVGLECCALLGLRSRRHRVGSNGMAGLIGGLIAPLPIVATVWWTEPAWREPLMLTVAAAGLLGTAALVLAPARSVRLGRLAELAEGLLLVAVPPSLLLATGVLDAVHRLVP